MWIVAALLAWIIVLVIAGGGLWAVSMILVAR